MMKRIIILIALFSLLNSCYYIKQAILDEQIDALRRQGEKEKGIKRKNDIEIWDLKRDELKKKVDESRESSEDISNIPMVNVVYEGENISLPERTTFKKSSLYI